MIKKLIYLSVKLLNAIEQLQKKQGIKKREKQKLIEEVLLQQIKKQKGEKITSPILSLSKPYIRPIVRGKEVKRVEFGAKVNKLQIDGINFIEHISFNPFHEGIRYEQSVEKSEQLTVNSQQ